jgi:thioredoxin 1
MTGVPCHRVRAVFALAVALFGTAAAAAAFTSNTATDSSCDALYRSRRLMRRVTAAVTPRGSSSLLALHATVKFKSFEGMLGELQKEPLLLVYFYKNLCGPCQLQRRELKGIAARLPKVLAVDVEKWPHLGTRHKIGSLPCVLMIREGQEVDRWEGLTMSGDLLDRVAAFQEGRGGGQVAP